MCLFEGDVRGPGVQPAKRHFANREGPGGDEPVRRTGQIQPGEGLRSGVELPEQQEPADLHEVAVEGVGAISVGLQRPHRAFERGMVVAAELAGGERDLGARDHAPRPFEPRIGGKGPLRPCEKSVGPGQVSQLREGDPAERERRRVLSQRDEAERAEGIARRQGAGGGGEQRVHGTSIAAP